MNFAWKQMVSEGFEPFVCEEKEISWQVYYEEKPHLSEPVGKLVYENQAFQVFLDENGNCYRRFHDYRTGYEPYAMMHVDFQKKTVWIEYLLDGIGHFGSSRNDFFHIGWENILSREGRMILHAACVDTSFGGILFSGPSGVGKSTQADLWCKHRRAVLLNGDRPIVRNTESGWVAYGSPYAGSSRCYVNEKCKLKAIVMLKQAETCQLRKLNNTESFRRIYGQVTVNNWDKEYVTKVCDLLLELIGDVPVYELSCTPNQAAVEILAEELGR